MFLGLLTTPAKGASAPRPLNRGRLTSVGSQFYHAVHGLISISSELVLRHLVDALESSTTVVGVNEHM